MDGYGTELGEVLLSVQLALISEEQGVNSGQDFLGDLLPLRWEREVAVPNTAVPPATWMNLASSRTKRREAATAELRLLDPETGAGTLVALRRDLALELDLAGENSADRVSLFAVDLEPEEGSHPDAGGDTDTLRAVVELAPFHLRRTDRMYRIAGRELAVLLPDMDAEQVELVRARLDEAVQRVLTDRHLPAVRIRFRALSLDGFLAPATAKPAVAPKRGSLAAG